MNEQLIQSIKEHEGLRLKVYECPAGKQTIGFGRNLEDRGITKKEAEYLLMNDLLDIKLELEDNIPFFDSLDEVRRNVLIEMAYNMGVPNLLKFKNMLRALKEERFLSASQEMLDSKWHRNFKKIAPYALESQLRSSKLALIMKKGEY